MFSFAYPWLLLLEIPAVAALIAFAVRRRPAVRIPSIEPVRQGAIRKRFLHWKTLLPFVIYLVAVTLFVLALGRPRFGMEEIRRRTEGVDIMIALDLSESMLAFDIPRSASNEQAVIRGIGNGEIKNRLETAKLEIAKFIEARPNDRIGLIVFAPQPYAACPPTLDHAWLIANLETLKAGAIGSTTNIAGPIASAVRRLKDSNSKRRVIVLFTDGRNNVADKVTPLQAAQLAAKFNITVYTVGIGSGNSLYEQYGRLYPVRDEFDEPMLREISDATKGKYYHAADSDGMAAAMKAINALERTRFDQKTLINWRDLGFPLILAGIILLITGFLFENTFCLKTP